MTGTEGQADRLRQGRFSHFVIDPAAGACRFRELDWAAVLPEARPDPMKTESLARAGFGAGDTGFATRFETAHRAWMASQFLNGEAAAAAICDGLARSLPDAEARDFAEWQARDEYRHHAVLGRFLRERVEEAAFAPADAFAELVRQIVSDRRWDVKMLGLQIFIESLALATFRLTAACAPDPVLRGIAAAISHEEECHVGFGLAMLGEAGRGWTAAERREREDFALEAAELLSQRYLMGELWERLGINRERGEAFTRVDPLMVAYRRTVFHRIRSAVAELGLMSPRVADGMGKMGLSGRAHWRLRA